MSKPFGSATVISPECLSISNKDFTFPSSIEYVTCEVLSASRACIVENQ